jgi:hypothetical protein
MFRRALAILMSLLMAGSLPAAEPRNFMTPQEAILDIPTGTPIEVRLKKGGRLRGRLDAVRDAQFDMTVAAKDRLETRTLAYSDVKSLKERKPITGGTVALGILAGLGICAIVFTILLASTGFE